SAGVRGAGQGEDLAPTPGPSAPRCGGVELSGEAKRLADSDAVVAGPGRRPDGAGEEPACAGRVDGASKSSGRVGGVSGDRSTPSAASRRTPSPPVTARSSAA